MRHVADGYATLPTSGLRDVAGVIKMCGRGGGKGGGKGWPGKYMT